MSADGKKQKKLRLRVIASYAIVAAAGLLMLYPLYYSFFGSLVTNSRYLASGFIPWPPLASEFANYQLIFQGGFGKVLFRSIIITVLRIAALFVMTTFTSVLAGYVYAKMRFPFKRTMFMILMASMMIPGVAMIVPNFVWMRKFPLVGGNDILGRGGQGFLDNVLFLFIPGWVNVYNIFLCRQAFSSLGDEMKEAAQVDGAGFFRVVFIMYMPLIAPILAVMFLNLFLGVWNDYLTSMIYLPFKPQYHTIGYTLISLINYYINPLLGPGEEFPKVFAISVVSMAPPIVAFVFLQKAFVSGLTMGSVKG